MTRAQRGRSPAPNITNSLMREPPSPALDPDPHASPAEDLHVHDVEWSASLPALRPPEVEGGEIPQRDPGQAPQRVRAFADGAFLAGHVDRGVGKAQLAQRQQVAATAVAGR